LRGQHIHDLSAGNARHQLHGEGDDALLREGLHRLGIAVGVHDGQHHSARFHLARQFALGTTHGQDDIGILKGVIGRFGDGGAGGFIGRIRNG
jgi:hypothetical protein